VVTTNVPPTGQHAAADALASGAELVLFDLDGVLVDTLPVMRSAWEAVRSDYGIQIPFESYVQHLGRPFPDIMALLGLHTAEGVESTYDAVSLRNAHLARPFPGIEEALRTIASAGCQLGVVTSKPLARAARLLDRLGCPLSVIRTPTRERGKPAPDTLLTALVEARTDPADAIYVGDMAVDQEAARRAGVRYVHAGWGYGTPAEPIPLVLHTPTELVLLTGRGEDVRPV